MDLEPLTAISPLDGRYRRRVEALAPLASEWGLMRYRVRVEVEWFAFLAAAPEIAELPALDAGRSEALRAIWQEFDVADGRAIQELEAETNHDVKAVEYFVKRAVARIDGLAPHVEFVHFACTSEDVNNLAYGLMLSEIRATVLAPALRRLIQALRDLASPLADAPMLARTHGQAASPTTAGKELANVVARLQRQLDALEAVDILGKMNGAVGNYNAHALALPRVDWPKRCAEFVASLGMSFNPATTQIEPHDALAAFCHALMRCNQVALDFDRDMWGYVALGYFRQRPASGETGSSTMPHKVNPIDFENSEGNLGLANALLGHLAEKLPVSRWQRDLSDSTALRNLGAAFAHCLLAYSSAVRGIGRLEADRDRLAEDLDGAWEVLAEAVQTALRAGGADKPYERLKALTRGERLDRRGYLAMVEELPLRPDARQRLERLTPAAYTGLAERLAREILNAGFKVAEVPWSDSEDALLAVRRAVFIDEQGVSEAEEFDGADETSRHFLATDASGRPIGTARLLPNGQIGRMAVLAAWRGRHVGARLLALAVDAAHRQGRGVFLNAQLDAVGFYERNGFKAEGEVFVEADIQHRKMTPRLPGSAGVSPA